MSNLNALAPEIFLVYASETGFTEEVAERTQNDLQMIGIEARLIELDDLGDRINTSSMPIFFLVSTTGDGDPPFNATLFSDEKMSRPADLSSLRYGLLYAGDSSYPTFCGFGLRLLAWLQETGAQSIFDPVQVDSEDETAVQQWRDRVLWSLQNDYRSTLNKRQSLRTPA